MPVCRGCSEDPKHVLACQFMYLWASPASALILLTKQSPFGKKSVLFDSKSGTRIILSQFPKAWYSIEELQEESKTQLK